MPQQLGRFVQEDRIDPSLRRQVCERCRYAGLESTTVDVGLPRGKHGYVQIAVRPVTAFRTGTEDREDRETRQVVDGIPNPLIESSHGTMLAPVSRPSGPRAPDSQSAAASTGILRSTFARHRVSSHGW